jgi:hypothetical protein
VTVPDRTVARKMHRTLEPYHGLVYFAREPADAYASLGITDRQMGYFASRSAAMGAVSAEVVIATFYNFSPALVRRAIPAAWVIAGPEPVLAARLAGVDAGLRAILGDGLESNQTIEAALLARKAAQACSPEGRPLYAAHAALDWPDEPHLQLWLAITLLREHRGDGHIAGLVDHEVSGCEALVVHGATGEVPPRLLQATRGRTDAEWAEAVESLRTRGWLDDDGGLTDAGRADRDELEARTDELAMAPWRHLGEEGCTRLRELVRPFSRAIVESGTFGR